jgi:hypothetical protein
MKNSIQTLFLAVQGGKNTKVIDVTSDHWIRVAGLVDWSAAVVAGNIQLHLGVGSCPVTLKVDDNIYKNVIGYEFKAFSCKDAATDWLKS